MDDSVVYITADRAGTPTGGGVVTHNEYLALKEIYPEAVLYDKHALHPPTVDSNNPKYFEDPWMWDARALNMFINPKLAHFYAGTFTQTISYFLMKPSAIVTYTAAAHDLEESIKEHEIYGMKYGNDHMTNPAKWKRYLRGYLLATNLICPSTHSANVMRSFGRQEPIEVIPHGCDLPMTTIPLPSQFRVGYLGSCLAPDKGLIYLLQAWKKLNLSDAILYLGGRDSTHPFLKELIYKHGGGCIRILSWVENVSSFYNQISLYIQPSVTEGFGIEIVEAMAHGRAVIASKGAGGHETLPKQEKTFEIRNVDQLCELIQGYYKDRNSLLQDAEINRSHAENFTWQKVRQKYVALWKKLAGGDRD